jgi:hypothetical protein
MMKFLVYALIVKMGSGFPQKSYTRSDVTNTLAYYSKSSVNRTKPGPSFSTLELAMCTHFVCFWLSKTAQLIVEN